MLGALASGQTVIRNAGELRVKETDRLTALTTNLKAMGAQVEEYADGMVIHGGRPLHGARLHSYGDHRIAMAFAVAGLFAEGETIIEDCDCIETSYPTFNETLQPDHHGVDQRRGPTPVISDARQFLPPDSPTTRWAAARGRRGRGERTLWGGRFACQVIGRHPAGASRCPAGSI